MLVLRHRDLSTALGQPKDVLMDVAELARLRPMMPVRSLIALAGESWEPLDRKKRGYFWGLSDQFGFTARIDAEGHIGSVSFTRKFPPELVIEGLQIGMTLQAARAARPNLALLETDEKYQISEHADVTEAGDALRARFKDDRLIGFELSRPGLTYLEPLKLVADPRLTRAYDLVLGPPLPLPVEGREGIWAQGWCYGLPPGISPLQWPLSPRQGHPMRHAFTVAVPEQYRTKGQDLVALSLFVEDQFRAFSADPRLLDFMTAPLSDQPPQNEALIPFWRHRKARHGHHHGMIDALHGQYAAIWLTREEFEGALCSPPDVGGSSLLRGSPTPDWLGASYSEFFHTERVWDGSGSAHDWPAGSGLETAFPIRISDRVDDPNIGKPPREWADECVDSGYVPAGSEAAKDLDLYRFTGRSHFGGTMLPEQGYPEFGPYFLEIEEYFGGFNFGGGRAQIDLEQMKIDWACG